MTWTLCVYKYIKILATISIEIILNGFGNIFEVFCERWKLFIMLGSNCNIQKPQTHSKLPSVQKCILVHFQYTEELGAYLFYDGLKYTAKECNS